MFLTLKSVINYKECVRTNIFNQFFSNNYKGSTLPETVATIDQFIDTSLK